jgi:hypothetical protein
MFWPATGHTDRPWLDDPDEDAFVRSARGVCELYSAGLRPAQIQWRRAELRLICLRDDARDDVQVVVFTDPPTAGFEQARVDLPGDIAVLPGAARARLALDVVHGATLRMARARGWDPAAPEAARTHALAHSLHYRWEGPAKLSPDRRHQAYPVYRLYDDGYGRVVVQVRRVLDDQLVAGSEPALAFSTSAGFVRSARTLRWHGSSVVKLVPFCGLFGDDHGLVTVDLNTAPKGSGVAEHPADEPFDSRTTGIAIPPVVIVGEGRRLHDLEFCLDTGQVGTPCVKRW